MKDSSGKSADPGMANLAIDPDVLARELAAELLGDPLDEIDAATLDNDDLSVTRQCDSGLVWLQKGYEERLQGLRVFCEHRDIRAIPLLLPLLNEPCPVIRMSAVYALGRNPHAPAVEALLQLLQEDSNAYVRKAAAWTLGNYPGAPVLKPLIHALQNDVAAVRIWASGSLAKAGATSVEKADYASTELLLSLQIDSEPVVRSNCIWALGRLYDILPEARKQELVDAFVNVLIQDDEVSVRDEARSALETLENPSVGKRLQALVDEGTLI